LAGQSQNTDAPKILYKITFRLGLKLQWLVPTILAIWETEIGGSQLEASPDKNVTGRPCLKE
jgi:hypothetical protein